MSKKLELKFSDEDRVIAIKILKLIKRNKWKRLKQILNEEDVDPDSFLNKRETGLHVAAKLGHAESLHVLLDLGASTKIKDKKGNLALHLAIKCCLKNYSRSVDLDVVNVLTNATQSELDAPNFKGTTPNMLLRGLDLKREMEDGAVSESSSSVSSVSDKIDFSNPNSSSNFYDRLKDEASEEYFDQHGKWDKYDQTELKEETYNEWADRIYSEYWKKRYPKSTEVRAKTATPSAEPPKLKLKHYVQDSTKKDIYIKKSKKLFETTESITVQDIPFKVNSSADSVIEIILGNEPPDKVRARLQNALRRWHPDKFQQWSHGRIENDVDKENILKIVTHVSQILLSYGK